MIEDVINRSDGAADLSGEVAGLQGVEPVAGDGAFRGVDQLLAQRRVPIGLPHDSPS